MAITSEFRPYPTTTTTAFGRFFAGIDNRILFSQILVDDVNTLGRCYQKNDPTSPEISDLLATDGGEIPLQNSGNIIKTVEFQRGVIAFCEQGVWYISGPESGFTADAYDVFKITEDTLYAYNSITNVGDVILYAAEEGIMSLQPNEFGTLKATNLTETVINEYYNEFITDGVGCVYEPINKQVWYYNGANDKALIQDLRTNAFYPQKFELTANQSIKSAYRIPNDEYVKFVYEDISTNQFGVLELKDETFEDLGTSFSSYIVTAEESLGQFTHKKNTPSVYVLMNKTEQNITGFDGTNYTYDYPSACTFSAEFDYTTSSNANAYTPTRQIYNVNRRLFTPAAPGYPVPLDDGRSIVDYRDIVRGSGRSVRFKFQSEDNKDMQILGYSVEYSMRGRQ